MRTADSDLDNISAICCRDEVEGQVVVSSKLEAFLSHLVVHCRGRGEQGWTDTHAQCHGPHIAERLFKSIDFTTLHCYQQQQPPPPPPPPLQSYQSYYCMVYAYTGKDCTYHLSCWPLRCRESLDDSVSSPHTSAAGFCR